MGSLLIELDKSNFTPKMLGSLELWLDASDLSTITESSGAVSQWDDKSGNSNNATQGTGTNQPTTGSDTLNNKNTLTFDGSNDYLSISDFSSILDIAANFTVFFAFRWNGTVSTSRTLTASTVSTSNRFVATINTNGHLIVGTYNGSSYNTKTLAVSADTSTRIFSITHTSADVISAWLNGSEITGATETPATSNNSGTTIGARTFGDSNFDDYLAEVIIYSRILSASERTKVENYLSNKWGA